MIPTQQALEWLLADDCWWLWSVETQRDAIRLLVVLTPLLDTESFARLEQAVLAGPPRTMFKDDIEVEDLVDIVEMEIWKRLAKINHSGGVLGAEGKAKLDELSKLHPKWKLATDGSDEFPVWSTDVHELTPVVPAPRRPRQLVEWLTMHPGTDWQDDDWSQRCRDDIRAAACALCALATEDIWPTVRWRQALHVWSEATLTERSWRYLAPLLADAPHGRLQPVGHQLSRWLLSVAKSVESDEKRFLRLCQTILQFDYTDGKDGDDDNPMSLAVNHPVGHVTEALLNWWIRSPPEEGQNLPDTLRATFTALSDVSIVAFRHGRVILAWKVITLLHRDGEWTVPNLLPLFDWNSSKTEARAAWSGLLASPRLYRPLLESIKRPFLDTAYYYDALQHTYRKSYTALLTSAALDRGEIFTAREIATAIHALPEEGLRNSVEVLIDALDTAGGQRLEFWRNRILPFLRQIWPKHLDHKTPAMSECLGRLCIAADEEFPAALQELRHWLQPPPHLGRIMRRLEDSGMCQRYSEQALDFLGYVVGDTPPVEDKLGECLATILSTAPKLQDDPRFQRLRVLSNYFP